jgi:uncharacterized membrane-anchored protein
VKRGRALLLCLLPQFLLVAGMAAREESAFARGVEVRLAVRPVDPMSLFAGRYVSVPLAIERIDSAATRIEPGLVPGLAWDEEVFVRLEQAEPVWRAAEVTRHPPGEKGAVFLRGTWRRDGTIDYGIDTFYIPETGADPSRLALALVLRVTPEGRGRIADLLVQGRPYAEWNAAQGPR